MDKRKSLHAIVWIALLTIGLLLGQALAPSSSRNIYLDELPASQTYVVEGDGTDYWAIRYDGLLCFRSTNWVSVLQSALNGLTAGRTWQETVLVKGNITVTSAMMDSLPIQQSDYTELDFGQSRITYTGSNKSKNIIENSDRANGNEYLTIKGGFFDGQRGSISYQDTENEGYQSVGNCILWQKVGQSHIEYTNIKSFAGNALGVYETANNTYAYMTAEDCGGYGQFEQSFEQDCVYLSCRAVNSNDGDNMGVDGFDWCSMTLRDTFIFCEAINNTFNGFSDFNGGMQYGYNHLVTCKASANTFDGFFLYYGDILEECLAKNNGQYGVYIPSNAHNCRILGGTFTDDQTPKTQAKGIVIHSNAKNVTIIGADVRGNNNTAISIGGTSKDDTIRDCLGFVTENSGILELACNSTFAHSLAGTPTSVSLLVEETDANYIIQLKSKNSTHCQIYLYDLTASAEELIPKTVHWSVEYEP